MYTQNYKMLILGKKTTTEQIAVVLLVFYHLQLTYLCAVTLPTHALLLITTKNNTNLKLLVPALETSNWVLIV